MNLIDFVTCCCYMLLRKFHYSDWDAKYTAILNSSVILDFYFNASLDIVLLLSSTKTLQYIYSYPKMRYVLSGIITLVILVIRYYFYEKEFLSVVENNISRNLIDNKWILLAITASALISSFIVLLCVTQFVISQGIVFG